MTTEFFMPMHPPTVTQKSGQPDKTDRPLMVFIFSRECALEAIAESLQ